MFWGTPWWPKYTHFGINCPCRRWFVNIAWRGRNMHFLRRATHSTWIGVRSAEHMLGKSDCPCTNAKVEHTIFFQISMLKKCQSHLCWPIFAIFKKHLKNEGRVVVLIFYFPRQSRGISRFQHNTGNATTTEWKLQLWRGHGSFILGILHQNEHRKRRTWCKINT